MSRAGARLGGWVLPIVSIAIVIAIVTVQPLFLTSENLVNVFRQSAFLAIFALGQMLPIVTRGLDLSQGGVVTLSSVCFAITAGNFGTPAGAIIALAIGLFAGIANGALVAAFDISPFVVTLGMGFALQGLALIFSNGQPIFNVPEDFSALGWGTLGNLPVPTVIAVCVLGLVYFTLTMTIAGRFIYAVGSNPRASMLAGIPVRQVTVWAYATSGLLTALGSLLVSSRINSGHPTAGADTALQAIAAVVIGGVSLFGGRGSALGVALGAIFLSILSNALNLLNISSYVQQVCVGIAIILAVMLDRLRAASSQT